MIYSRIVGTGSYLPPRVMSNAEFEARLDTSDAWIRERTGIVVKSHGSADVYAFGQALRRAEEEVRNDVLERIARRMAEMQAAPPLARSAAA